MVSEKSLLAQLRVEEKKATARLNVVKARQKIVAKSLAAKVRVANLKKRISAAKRKGKRPLLSSKDKVILKKGYKVASKKFSFATDVIAFGYSEAVKRRNKRNK